MKQRPRIYYTDEQKALMWYRWQKGESMNAIGRLFDRRHSSIQRILLEMGGLPPTPRKRSALSLTLAEREEISRGKPNAVARQLNERPRKTLNFETPAERFAQCVASTGWNRNQKQPFRRIQFPVR